VARPRGQVVSPSQRPGDPENIPHDDEERGAATTSNPETETQVSGHVRPELLVTDSARTTLSRWRHGFEPRWDFKERRRSDGPLRLSGESAGPFVPHMSRGRPRHVAASEAETTTWAAPFVPARPLEARSLRCLNSEHRFAYLTRATYRRGGATSRTTSVMPRSSDSGWGDGSRNRLATVACRFRSSISRSPVEAKCPPNPLADRDLGELDRASGLFCVIYRSFRQLVIATRRMSAGAWSSQARAIRWRPLAGKKLAWRGKDHFSQSSRWPRAASEPSGRAGRRLFAGLRDRRLHDRPALAPRLARSSSSCPNVSRSPSPKPMASSVASFDGWSSCRTNSVLPPFSSKVTVVTA
jgi:hypothetical protein